MPSRAGRKTNSRKCQSISTDTPKSPASEPGFTFGVDVLSGVLPDLTSSGEKTIDMPIFVIDGSRFSTIPGFYRELNDPLMSNESWDLSESLDAFNDLLYCGYGALQGSERITVTWLHADLSRDNLGVPATSAWIESKLADPHGRYNVELLTNQLADLQYGTGKTYFELPVEIIEEHPRVASLICTP